MPAADIPEFAGLLRGFLLRARLDGAARVQQALLAYDLADLHRHVLMLPQSLAAVPMAPIDDGAPV